MTIQKAIELQEMKLRVIEKNKPSFGASQFEVQFHSDECESLRTLISAGRAEIAPAFCLPRSAMPRDLPRKKKGKACAGSSATKREKKR